MVIAYFHIMGVAFFPSETNSPLVVDPYAVLPFPAPLKSLKPVSWRGRKGIQFFRGIYQQ